MLGLWQLLRLLRLLLWAGVWLQGFRKRLWAQRAPSEGGWKPGPSPG